MHVQNSLMFASLQQFNLCTVYNRFMCASPRQLNVCLSTTVKYQKRLMRASQLLAIRNTAVDDLFHELLFVYKQLSNPP
jgi:hypothetical protein